GPGTGKTHTVGVLLALLLEQARGQPLRIALAAPTGKAAARLQESIKKLKPGLPCGDEIKAALPEEAFTVHRLLGSLPDSACLKYNAENPLPFDVVVVDEASMVDLALMSKLFAATAPAARIILLGDKDQLASVEAGAVLGDICHGAFDCQLPIADCRLGSIQPALPLAFPPIANRNLAGCIAQLRKNYRFGADNGILALSTAINRGDAERALELLSAAGKELAGIRWAALPTPNQMKERLREQVLGGFGDMLRAPDPRSALQGLNRFRILCALRQGPHGVETSNRLVELILAEAGLISTHSQWYSGRPVMVTRNDPHLKLFNGDIGIILPAGATGEPRAWFLGADNALRSLLPLRLPAHETVFAMTVHKSQGSEFENVLLVLPDRVNPVLTRELVYTGVTRASRRVELWFTPPVFRAAVARRVERTSGLREALWGQRS
ncbi:MAG TPA: exodeoxyribonuclease V subunit alpha, partial [Candidatus Binatia bacterium]|nr:exodeoxyribonuclease V subunit alpha [Candidatus Binatia bacterium]